MALAESPALRLLCFLATGVSGFQRLLKRARGEDGVFRVVHAVGEVAHEVRPRLSFQDMAERMISSAITTRLRSSAGRC